MPVNVVSSGFANSGGILDDYSRARSSFIAEFPGRARTIARYRDEL